MTAEAERALEDWLTDNLWPHAYELAAAIVTSSWLAGVKADVWDEGFDKGDDFGYGVGRGDPLPADPNPYRTEVES